jgi:phage terminase large subunit-like protein
MAALPKHVKDAILCGPVPKVRNWKRLVNLTEGEKVLRFAYDYMVFPEGKLIGKPLELDIFQQAFILAVFDAPEHISKAVLSIARRNGKTLVMAVIALAFVIGPHARLNTTVISAAMTRKQAALLFRFMKLICEMSPKIPDHIYNAVSSSKTLTGLKYNVEYQAISREASSNLGVGAYVLILDEAGQIVAPNDDFLDALFSSMGTYDDSRTFTISTQAQSDSAYLSIEIDEAERNQPPNVVCHVYAAKTDDILSETNWNQANPALRAGYRSRVDLQNNAREAEAIPAKSSGFLNLYLNRRVDRLNRWLAAKIWKANSAKPDLKVFKEKGIHLGLDLSQRLDLTSACMTARDDKGSIHVKCFNFTPAKGLKEREKRDKVPYSTWVKSGELIAVPAETIDYNWVAQYLKIHIEDEGILIKSIEFDSWKMDSFKVAAAAEGFAQGSTEYNEVRQGFKTMTVLIDTTETLLLQKKIRHGSAPVLNMGAASAVVVSDPALNRKLVKPKQGAGPKIDALVAMLMGIQAATPKAKTLFDANAMIG